MLQSFNLNIHDLRGFNFMDINSLSSQIQFNIIDRFIVGKGYYTNSIAFAKGNCLLAQVLPKGKAITQKKELEFFVHVPSCRV